MSGALLCQAVRPWGGRPGPVALVSRARVAWARGPSTGPTACALASLRCALLGWWEGVPGERASCCREGRLRLGAHPLLTAPSGGGWSGPLPASRGPGCVRVGTGHCPIGVRALRAVARRGGGGRLPLGGGTSHCCKGRLVSVPLTPPAACPWGGQPGGIVARASRARAMWAWGPCNSPTACAPACCGGGEGHPSGAAPHRNEGRLRLGAHPPPAAFLQGGLSGSGSAAHLLWLPVCGCGRPSLPLWHGCSVAVARRGGGRGSPRLGDLSPLPASSGRGWFGRGDPALVPRRACLRAVGVAEECPLGGCLAPL